MYHITSKNKILFLALDILSIIFSYKTLILIVDERYTFFDNNYFIVYLVLLTLITNIFTEEYRYIENRGYLKELKYSIVYAINVTVVFCFILIISKEKYIVDLEKLELSILVYLICIALCYTYLLRIIGKVCVKYIQEDKKKAIVLTDFSKNTELENQINVEYDIVAYINFYDDNTDYYNNKKVLNNVDNIRDFIANNRVDEIFIESNLHNDREDIFKYFKVLGIPITIDISEFEKRYVGNTAIKNVGNKMFITSAIKITTLKQVFMKRVIDVIGGIIGIFITFIVAIIIYPKIQKESKGPIIFRQKRVGLNGRVFNIYKFRSMYLDAEDKKKELINSNDLNTTLMFKMKNDPRIFPFGQKLRDWSIDELPQFINVLKGDMSLVGTRPPTLEEYKNYELHHFKRLATKPGITGLWQVSGRSNIEDFEKVVELDLKYIQNWSIRSDIKILLKTIKVVLNKDGSR